MRLGRLAVGTLLCALLAGGVARAGASVERSAEAPDAAAAAADPMPPERELERRRGTMRDLERLGRALATWAADHAAPVPAAERGELRRAALAARAALPPMPKGFYLWREGTLRPVSSNELGRMLRPTTEVFYLRNLPIRDRWGTRIEVLGSPENLFGLERFALRSAGPNRRFDGDRVPIGAWREGDENDDLVWVDGAFVRWSAAAPAASTADSAAP